MATADYYELLEVARDADGSVLKKSYRRLAMKFHPDRNPGDKAAEDSFKEISEAYEVLSNPEKRQIYDQYGHEGLKGRTGFSNAEDIFSQFGDIFGDFFGFGRRKKRGPPQGDHLQYNLQMTLEECFHGTDKALEIPRQIKCDPCEGRGAKKGTGVKQCRTCNGAGQVVMNRGFFQMAQACPQCRGKGQTIPYPCAKCHGKGTTEKIDTVTVKIPAGIDEGMKLRVVGKGSTAPEGGIPGDLYVVIHPEEHTRFERHHSDLVSEIDINIVDATLGKELTFEGINDTLELTIPAGTQPGAVLKLSEQGMPDMRSKRRGSLHLRVNVVVPKHLNKTQRDLLQAFADAAD